MRPGAEVSASFECFGSTCAAFVSGSGQAGSAREATAMITRELQAWQYSAANYRFVAAGENGHPALDRAPARLSAVGQITLPPLSFTVVRSRL